MWVNINPCPRAGARRRILTGVSLAVLAAALAGCMVGPDFEKPAPPTVAKYTNGADPTVTESADGIAQNFNSSDDLPVEWWRLFKNPVLDAVVRQGIASSPTIESAEASLRQSEDTLQAEYGIFYPHVDAGFSATRQQIAPESQGKSGPGAVFNLLSLSAVLSYTLDIFGGERRSIEAMEANVEQQRNTARTAYMTLSSTIVNTVVSKAAFEAEIEATQEIIASQQEQAHLTEIQAQAGRTAYSAVLSLQAQLEATEATLPPLRQKLSQSENQLAMLAGRAPANWRMPKISFADLSLPLELPVSLPSSVVHQRPDILSAEASLHAASAEIGVATAAMYPSITLNGSLGSANNTTNSFLSAGGQFWSVGADVVQPLFHGGTLWYQRKAAMDAFEASRANYRQTVLAAFQQVVDLLRAIEHDAEALAANERALNTAYQALQLVKANYNSGIAPYSDVLISNTQYFQARIADIQARAARYQDTVALFVALGGGWWNATNAPQTEAPQTGAIK